MAWEFTDDRGVRAHAAERPGAVLGYVRAGAALDALGVAVAGVYGSTHDSPSAVDPVKAGGLMGPDGLRTAYLGPGAELTPEAVAGASLLVDLTYDGERAYAVDEAVAAEAGLPLVALAVGGTQSVDGLLRRFGELAVALGAEPVPSDGRLERARAAVRTAAAESGGRVLALSPADDKTVHLARPETWPELRELTGLGVRMVEPGDPGGVNWATVAWERIGELAPDVLLVDGRSNALRDSAAAESAGRREATAALRTISWNPEFACEPGAVARFLEDVAEALGGSRPRE